MASLQPLHPILAAISRVPVPRGDGEARASAGLHGLLRRGERDEGNRGEREFRRVRASPSLSVSSDHALLFVQITTFLKSIFQSGVASVKKSKWTKVGGLREILLDQDASRTLDLTKEGYLLDDEVSRKSDPFVQLKDSTFQAL